MIPVIIISRSAEKQEKFIKTFIDKHSIHPFSVYHIQAIKNQITIDQTRSIKKEVTLQTKNTRLFILKGFDHANMEAQNAFLKTLEERSEDNYFLLTCSNVGQVLPTVRSRTVTIYLDKHNDGFSIRSSTRRILQALENDEDIRFLSDSHLHQIQRDEALILCDEIILFGRDALRNGNAKIVQVLKKAIKIRSQLERNNLNPQLTVDSLLISAHRALHH